MAAAVVRWMASSAQPSQAKRRTYICMYASAVACEIHATHQLEARDLMMYPQRCWLLRSLAT